MTDTPSLTHAKLSNQITNEVKSPDGLEMGSVKTARLLKKIVWVFMGLNGGSMGICTELWKENSVITQSLNGFQTEGPSRKSGLVGHLAPQMQSQTGSISTPGSLLKMPKLELP